MHNRICRTGFGIAMLMVMALLAISALPVRAELVINEVLPDPASDWDGDGEVDTKLDEWVEVYNPDSTPIMLTSYWLRDGLGDTPHLNLFGSLQPGETAVFYGFHATAWQEENGAGSSGLSLNNSGDTVQLLRTNGNDPDVLDVVDEFTYPTHVGEDDRAAGRLPDGEIWSLFDGLNPYEGDLEPQGNGCDPTPGELNLCADGTPVEAATWGEIKAWWRVEGAVIQ